MANAKLANYTFDINPSSASWGYTLNTFQEETYGGRVLQVLSCKIDDIIISGYIPLPPSGNRQIQFAEMEHFETTMRNLMESQVSDPPKPLRFTFDEMGWDGKVYLMGYDSVRYDTNTNAAQYTLNFKVDSGFEGVSHKIASDAMTSIYNIPDGVGWTRNRYNTPSGAYTYEKIHEALGKILDDIGTFSSLDPPTLYEYLEKLVEEKEKDKKKAAATTSTKAAESAVQAVATGARALFDNRAALGSGSTAVGAIADGALYVKNTLERLYGSGGGAR